MLVLILSILNIQFSFASKCGGGIQKKAAEICKLGKLKEDSKELKANFDFIKKNCFLYIPGQFNELRRGSGYLAGHRKILKKNAHFFEVYKSDSEKNIGDSALEVQQFILKKYEKMKRSCKCFQVLSHSKGASTIFYSMNSKMDKSMKRQLKRAICRANLAQPILGKGVPLSDYVKAKQKKPADRTVAEKRFLKRSGALKYGPRFLKKGPVNALAGSTSSEAIKKLNQGIRNNGFKKRTSYTTSHAANCSDREIGFPWSQFIALNGKLQKANNTAGDCMAPCESQYNSKYGKRGTHVANMDHMQSTVGKKECAIGFFHTMIHDLRVKSSGEGSSAIGEKPGGMMTRAYRKFKEMFGGK